MITSLRIGAIVCGLAYLAVGLVWVYWFALPGLLIGALGFGLARWADRRERFLARSHAGSTPSRSRSLSW